MGSARAFDRDHGSRAIAEQPGDERCACRDRGNIAIRSQPQGEQKPIEATESLVISAEEPQNSVTHPYIAEANEDGNGIVIGQFAVLEDERGDPLDLLIAPLLDSRTVRIAE